MRLAFVLSCNNSCPPDINFDLYYSRLHLKDVQEKKDAENLRANNLYALRRGLQLRQYVTTIRTELHEERARKKFERQNEILKKWVDCICIAWVALAVLLLRSV